MTCWIKLITDFSFLGSFPVSSVGLVGWWCGSAVLPSRKIAAAVASASIRARREGDTIQVDRVPLPNRVQFLVCRKALQTTFKSAGLPVSVAHFSISNRPKHQRWVLLICRFFFFLFVFKFNSLYLVIIAKRKGNFETRSYLTNDIVHHSGCD